MRIQRRQLIIVPWSFLLILAIPFTYYPRIVDGDTQPWVMLGALVSVVIFGVVQKLKLNRIDIAMAFLCLFAILSNIPRVSVAEDAYRFIFNVGLFFLLWIVVPRTNDIYLSKILKITVVIWFFVGLVQNYMVSIGIPLDMPGRFVEGRGGVPSLTPEPSVYGMISVLIILCLSSMNPSGNRVYAVLGTISIYLSGSLLAFSALLLSFFRFRMRNYFLMAFALFTALALLYEFVEVPILSRATTISPDLLLFDPSINLRLGHNLFSMYENFSAELLFQNDLSFQSDYNAWAGGTGVFIDTKSNFVLSSIGGLVYSSGIFGLLICVLILHRSFISVKSNYQRAFKVGFVAFCLINPIAISNIFLMIYVMKPSEK